MFEPKNYQRETLEWLRRYLEEARFTSPQTAFDTIRQQNPQTEPTPYHPLERLEDVPYICLRLPTGGGKTYLAARSIAVASDAYLDQDHPLVLWLVPTNTIRAQTLATLKNPIHPNRHALEAVFGGQLLVIDIADFNQIRPQDLLDKVVIVVGTMQTLRVNSTEGRKVYAHHEDLEAHFVSVPPNTPGLERFEDGSQRGEIKYSFRNLLTLHRPLVIIDEAHNATSELSVEVMQRVQPACIIEFTATPADSSNILHAVSAMELKAEEMIKLPIVLTQHETWQEAVIDSKRTRQKLHDLARLDPEYIHPIVLIQAEEHGREVTFDVIRKFLIEQEKIEPERIAIATGAQRELDGVNLLDPRNTVEFIITIEALKEGWDCPFAYVFCSVATVHSKKDVEQLLGRVLRMPYARKRQQEELNRAYAHVSASSWPQAVSQLEDHLVSMGFEEQEAESAIQPRSTLFPGEQDIAGSGNRSNSVSLVLSTSPNLIYLNPEELSRVAVRQISEGQVAFEVKGAVDSSFELKLVEAVAPADRDALQKTLSVYHRQQPHTPAQRGVRFAVPQLCLWADGALEIAEKDWFLDPDGWNLLDFPPELNPGEFNIQEKSMSFLIDINGRQLTTRYLGSQMPLDLQNADTGWNDLSLTQWLDSKLYQPDIRQEVLLEWLRRCLKNLVDQRGFTITVLARGRFLLEKALLEKIKTCRQNAYERGYQRTLFEVGAKVETSPTYAFTFDPNIYPAHWSYTGRYQFARHYYPIVGELESSGEEFECARVIDQCNQVKHWVRNLAQQPQFSFHLPLANGNFYPDFVCELTDGRILVVEYKGAHLDEYEKEKHNVGELWAEKSQGKALFLWAVKQDAHNRDVYRQLEAIL
jgi:type III restriction enzyme